MNREHQRLLHLASPWKHPPGDGEARMNFFPYDRIRAFLPKVPKSEIDPKVRPSKLIGMSEQLLLDAIPDAILMINQAGEIVVANAQTEKLFGYRREELVGRSVESLIPSRLRVEHMEGHKPLFGDPWGRPMGMGLPLFALRKDATEVPVEINLGRLTNEAGTFVVTAIRDVTDRHRIEGLKVLNAVLHETHESEERFSLIADTAPALIWMSDFAKLCTYVNKFWLDFTGQSMDSLLGNGWTEGIHPEDLRRREDTYAQALDRCEEFRMEYRLRRHDGEYRWILDIGVPRFDTGRSFVGYIGIGVDVTERKLAEVALEKLGGRLIYAQEEERARIARELHDDFSQRLAIQHLELGQLRDKLAETEREERAMVQKILTKGKEISADLRSLSHRLYSSKLELVGLVPALSGLCEEISQKSGIAVHFSGYGASLSLSNDMELCLFRVSQEALSNVVKYSEAKSARVHLSADANGVSLRISDEGKGFDTDFRNSEEGIGLGSMRERLRLVGGKLSVHSELMNGTEILAEIPRSAFAKQSEMRTKAAGGVQS